MNVLSDPDELAQRSAGEFREVLTPYALREIRFRYISQVSHGSLWFRASLRGVRR